VLNLLEQGRADEATLQSVLYIGSFCKKLE